jgi:hypothetical protein
MAAYSQVSERKRGRDDYWNGGLALPDAKRTINRTLAYNSDLMSLLNKIDDMDNIDNNPEETHAVNELDGENGFNAVLKSLEAEIGLEAQAHNDIESTDEKGNNDQMGSIKEGELSEWNSEATRSVYDIRIFKNYDDVGAQLCFLADHISPDEFGIIINYIDGDSMSNTMFYSDAEYGNAETTEDFYGSLWDDDIWEMNEHPVIQNDFASPQQKEFGISGAIWDC